MTWVHLAWLHLSFQKVPPSPDAVSGQLRTHSHNRPQRFALLVTLFPFSPGHKATPWPQGEAAVEEYSC